MIASRKPQTVTPAQAGAQPRPAGIISQTCRPFTFKGKTPWHTMFAVTNDRLYPNFLDARMRGHDAGGHLFPGLARGFVVVVNGAERNGFRKRSLVIGKTEHLKSRLRPRQCPRESPPFVVIPGLDPGIQPMNAWISAFAGMTQCFYRRLFSKVSILTTSQNVQDTACKYRGVRRTSVRRSDEVCSTTPILDILRRRRACSLRAIPL